MTIIGTLTTKITFIHSRHHNAECTLGKHMNRNIFGEDKINTNHTKCTEDPRASETDEWQGVVSF